MPLATLMAEVEGRSVAVVGNARSLSQKTFGSAIDLADIVIRLDQAPMTSRYSHGTRTDWLALSVPIGRADLKRLNPARLLWMAPDRTKLSWNYASSPGFYLHPRADWIALRDELGAPPTTALMVTELLTRSAASKVALFGFDVHSANGAGDPHNHAIEQVWVNELLDFDPRFSLS